MRQKQKKKKKKGVILPETRAASREMQDEIFALQAIFDNDLDVDADGCGFQLLCVGF